MRLVSMSVLMWNSFEVCSAWDLQADANKVVLLVLHENTTKGMTLSEDPVTHNSNVLFRTGGAALLLSNR